MWLEISNQVKTTTKVKRKKEITRFAAIKYPKESELMLRVKHKIMSDYNYVNTKISFLLSIA